MRQPVALYVDIHGHSRKQRVFMYGCDDRRKPRPAVRAGEYIVHGTCLCDIEHNREWQWQRWIRKQWRHYGNVWVR